MHRFPYFALLTLILLSACGRSPLASPTATPLPSNTPQPTASQTALPTSTSTPDITATAAANVTLVAEDVISDLDKVLGDSEIPYPEGHLAWKQDEPLNIEMTGPDQGFLAIAEDLTAGDFILKSDVTWNATGLMVRERFSALRPIWIKANNTSLCSCDSQACPPGQSKSMNLDSSGILPRKPNFQMHLIWATARPTSLFWQ
jgi:hypothetical protein